MRSRLSLLFTCHCGVQQEKKWERIPDRGDIASVLMKTSFLSAAAVIRGKKEKSSEERLSEALITFRYLHAFSARGSSSTRREKRGREREAESLSQTSIYTHTRKKKMSVGGALTSIHYPIVRAQGEEGGGKEKKGEGEGQGVQRFCYTLPTLPTLGQVKKKEKGRENGEAVHLRHSDKSGGRAGEENGKRGKRRNDCPCSLAQALTGGEKGESRRALRERTCLLPTFSKAPAERRREKEGKKKGKTAGDSHFHFRVAEKEGRKGGEEEWEICRYRGRRQGERIRKKERKRKAS